MKAKAKKRVVVSVRFPRELHRAIRAKVKATKTKSINAYVVAVCLKSVKSREIGK